MFIDGMLTAFQRDQASAYDLGNPVRLYEPQESRDFVIAARNLKDERRRFDINDMSPEKLCHLQDIEAVVVIRLDLDECHPAAYSVLGIQPLYSVDHWHLLELLDHLLDEIFITVHDNRDARKIRCFRNANRQTVDIELASGKHAYNADKNTSLVFDKNR